ncbi:hypothetical protein [Shinella sp.]|uniref:hypothetical protein n=1 Tax=Shinella sp. TaxID=1870904 RepID=UPI00289A7430|nr:hypothetical protein [Shinella sp.]
MGNLMHPTLSAPREERIARFGFKPEIAEKILRADRCFIIASGPSIAKVNLAGLKDELVIGVNFILRTSVRPDFICVSDPSRFDTANFQNSNLKIIIPKHVAERHKSVIQSVDCYSDIEYIDHQSLRNNVQHIGQHLSLQTLLFRWPFI